MTSTGRKYADIDVNLIGSTSGNLGNGVSASSFEGMKPESYRIQPVAIPRLPHPSLPGRSLPAAIGPDGSPVKLPPLPEGAVEDVADESDEPRPSPQARGVGAQSGSEKDERAEFVEDAVPMGAEGPFDPAPEPDKATETVTYRIPLGRTTMQVRFSTTRIRVAKVPAK